MIIHFLGRVGAEWRRLFAQRGSRGIQCHQICPQFFGVIQSWRAMRVRDRPMPGIFAELMKIIARLLGEFIFNAPNFLKYRIHLVKNTGIEVVIVGQCEEFSFPASGMTGHYRQFTSIYA